MFLLSLSVTAAIGCARTVDEPPPATSDWAPVPAADADTAERSEDRLLTDISIMVDSITYVISWAAWPLVMAYLTPMLDREAEYFRYVVAYNWSGGPQMLVLITMLLIGWSGFIPKDFLALLNLGALVVILLYHMFILRVVLRAAGLLSFALVVGEFMLGQMVLLIRHGMLQ
jgi:hypothetical protein